MVNIVNLKNILPITYGDKVLRLMSLYDIQWYTDNCRKEYYEHYMDFKFSSDITRDKLENIFNKLAVEYICNTQSNNEARLVLCIDSEIIGGVTIYEKCNDILELGYFVIPEYSSKGIGYAMLNELITKIKTSNIPYSKIIFTIREDNIASIKLAEKLGFSKTRIYKGKYKNNIEYVLERNT